jgi:hypothetical protein
MLRFKEWLYEQMAVNPAPGQQMPMNNLPADILNWVRTSSLQMPNILGAADRLMKTKTAPDLQSALRMVRAQQSGYNNQGQR